jgi:hypothetical protein
MMNFIKQLERMSIRGILKGDGYYRKPTEREIGECVGVIQSFFEPSQTVSEKAILKAMLNLCGFFMGDMGNFDLEKLTKEQLTKMRLPFAYPLLRQVASLAHFLLFERDLSYVPELTKQFLYECLEEPILPRIRWAAISLTIKSFNESSRWHEMPLFLLSYMDRLPEKYQSKIRLELGENAYIGFHDRLTYLNNVIEHGNGKQRIKAFKCLAKIYSDKKSDYYNPVEALGYYEKIAAELSRNPTLKKYVDVYRNMLDIARLRHHADEVKDFVTAERLYRSIIDGENVAKSCRDDAAFDLIILYIYQMEKKDEASILANYLLCFSSLDAQKKVGVLEILANFGTGDIKDAAQTQLRTFTQDHKAQQDYLKELFLVAVQDGELECAEDFFQRLLANQTFEAGLAVDLTSRLMDNPAKQQLAVRLLQNFLQSNPSNLGVLQHLGNLLYYGHESVRDPMLAAHVGGCIAQLDTIKYKSFAANVLKYKPNQLDILFKLLTLYNCDPEGVRDDFQVLKTGFHILGLHPEDTYKRQTLAILGDLYRKNSSLFGVEQAINVLQPVVDDPFFDTLVRYEACCALVDVCEANGMLDKASQAYEKLLNFLLIPGDLTASLETMKQRYAVLEKYTIFLHTFQDNNLGFDIRARLGDLSREMRSLDIAISSYRVWADESCSGGAGGYL